MNSCYRAVASAFLAVGLLLAGCADRDAAARLKAAKDLDGALSRLEEARRLSDPSDPQKLTEAARKLAELADQGGLSAAQQAEARRVVAQVQLGEARVFARQANEGWAKMADVQASLIVKLAAISAAVDRANLFDVDQGPLVKGLRQFQEDQKTSNQERQRQIGELQKTLADLNAQKAEALAAQGAAQAEEQKLLEQVSQKPRSEQYALYDAAFAAQTRAEKAAVTAEKLEAEMAVKTDEIAALNKLVEQGNVLVASVEKQVTAAQKRQEDLDQLRKQTLGEDTAKPADDSKKKLVELFVKEFEDADRDYKNAVEVPFDSALKKVDDAIAQLQKAGQAADANAQRGAQWDLLCAQMVRVSLLTGQVTRDGRFGRALGIAAARAGVMKLDLKSLVAAAESVRQQQQQLADAADATAKEASDLVGKLKAGSGPGDELAALTSQQVDALRSYSAQISESRIAAGR